MYQKLSFVIPVYNEERTLEALLAKVEAVELGLEKELVLVDDGSRDGTHTVLEGLKTKPNYKILFNEKNMGKSQTVKKGLLATTGDLVVIQDADLEYEPQDLKEFVALFQAGKVEVVYGNRFGKHNKVIYWQNWIGNSFLSLISSILTGIRGGIWARDMEVCYKMAEGNIFRNVAEELVSTSRFGLEPELTARFAGYRLNGRRLRFAQIPINYYPRSIEEGKHMSAFRDGIKALIEIIKFNILSK